MQGMHVRGVQGLEPMALLYDHAWREVETGRLPGLQGRACMACKAGGVHGVRFKLDGWERLLNVPACADRHEQSCLSALYEWS